MFCVGLPHVGVRSLSDAEELAFADDERRLQRTIILCFTAIGLCVTLPVILWIVLTLVFDDLVRNDIVAIFGLVLLVVGIPLFAFLADKAFTRRKVVRLTLLSGTVRCFGGRLDALGLANDGYEILKNTDLISENPAAVLRVELHGVSDVVYRINGIQPKKWFIISLTRAARAPDSPARFSIPKEWEVSEEVDGGTLLRDDVKRRRLTEDERKEILQYARRTRKWRWLQMFLIGWFLASVMNVSARLLELAFPFAIAAWVILFAVLRGVWFYKQTARAETFVQDSQLGWTLIIRPWESKVSHQAEDGQRDEVEILPISGMLWMADDKPAGWRRLV